MAQIAASPTDVEVNAPVATPRIAQSVYAERARLRRRNERTLIGGLQIGLLVSLLIGMHLLNVTAGNLTMPSPVDVVDESIKMWSNGTMLTGLGQSLQVLVLAFLLSASTGIVGGIMLGGFPFLGRVLDPFVNAINSTPGIAFIPLIIVWFGLYTEAKIVVVWNAALFPILLSTTAGIANANKDLVEMARAFGANRWTLFWRVMVPDAIPSIISGLRIGAAVATVGTVAAELTMAQSGLGGLLAAAGNRFQMDKYFAVVFVLMAVGTLITVALRLAENRFARWRVAQREGR